MSFKDELKRAIHLAAVISSAATLHSAPLSAHSDDNSESSLVPSATEYLEQRIKRGTIINGETQEERSARWDAYKKEHGSSATLKAIQQEKIKKIEIPHKDENGYVFETYEPGKKHTFESYYSNGVLQAKSGENGDEAEGYYPDGSRKFVRTSNGVETKYHPGGKKGEEKIKETPHKLYEAYDVLDESGRRLEHHYDVTESPARVTQDGSSYTSRDIKKVDLYNPETKEVIGTYTLDHWGVDEGRIACIGFIDKSGTMKIMKFPKARQLGESDYYAHSLSLDQIKKIYHEEEQERLKKQSHEKEIKNFTAQR